MIVSSMTFVGVSIWQYLYQTENSTNPHKTGCKSPTYITVDSVNLVVGLVFFFVGVKITKGVNKVANDMSRSPNISFKVEHTLG